MNTVQIFANISKPEAPETAFRAAAFLAAAGLPVAVENTLSRFPGGTGFAVIEAGAVGQAGLALTFGGDGSVLRAVGICAAHGTPVLGIHMGTFGFLTYCRPDEMEGVLRQVAAGDFNVESRLMVRASVIRAGKSIAEATGLNEIAMQRGVTGKMLQIEIEIDEIPVTTYPADGLLISTPTGSTAYNLSAGGPVASPNLEALLLTPITPHTLGARPVVLAPDSLLRFKLHSHGEAVLVADGESMVELENGDEIVVNRAPQRAKLVLPSANDFYQRLRKRLLWGARTEA